MQVYKLKPMIVMVFELPNIVGDLYVLKGIFYKRLNAIGYPKELEKICYLIFDDESRMVAAMNDLIEVHIVDDINNGG